MKFECDSDKSAANREKHGIAFDEAQALWDDPYLIEAPANVTAEMLRLLQDLRDEWAELYRTIGAYDDEGR